MSKENTEKEVKTEKEEKVSPEKEKIKTISVEKYNKALEQIVNLNKEVENWKNKYYKAYADVDNLRKSIEKDHSDALKYRAEGFIDKLIPALDGFNMALNVTPSNQEMSNFLQGFNYIYNNIMASIESEGVSEINVKIGDKFDEKFMNAIDTVEQEGEENIVVQVLGRGYKLHDRIVRPAVVYVSCKPGSKDKKEEKSDEKDENK